jgi:hypothetical protein
MAPWLPSRKAIASKPIPIVTRDVASESSSCPRRRRGIRVPPLPGGPAPLRGPVDRGRVHPEEFGDGAAGVDAALQGQVGESLAGPHRGRAPVRTNTSAWFGRRAQTYTVKPISAASASGRAQKSSRSASSGNWPAAPGPAPSRGAGPRGRRGVAGAASLSQDGRQQLGKQRPESQTRKSHGQQLGKQRPGSLGSNVPKVARSRRALARPTIPRQFGAISSGQYPYHSGAASLCFA